MFMAAEDLCNHMMVPDDAIPSHHKHMFSLRKHGFMVQAKHPWYSSREWLQKYPTPLLPSVQMDMTSVLYKLEKFVKGNDKYHCVACELYRYWLINMDEFYVIYDSNGTACGRAVTWNEADAICDNHPLYQWNVHKNKKICGIAHYHNFRFVIHFLRTIRYIIQMAVMLRGMKKHTPFAHKSRRAQMQLRALCIKDKNIMKPMVFIVLHNDWQYTNHSPTIIGALDDQHDSLIFGWKTVIEAAQKPWNVRFYKNRKGEFADACGLGRYYIEKWDTSTNTRVKTYDLGEDQRKRKYVLDAYLKEHCREYETILQEWCNDIANNTIPSKLQEFTFVSTKF